LTPHDGKLLSSPTSGKNFLTAEAGKMLLRRGPPGTCKEAQGGVSDLSSGFSGENICKCCSTKPKEPFPVEEESTK